MAVCAQKDLAHDPDDRFIPGYKAKVIDDSDQAVPRGRIGSLAVIGPTDCRNLNGAQQRNNMKDGWTHLRDAFTLCLGGWTGRETGKSQNRDGSLGTGLIEINAYFSEICR